MASSQQRGRGSETDSSWPNLQGGRAAAHLWMMELLEEHQVSTDRSQDQESGPRSRGHRQEPGPGADWRLHGNIYLVLLCLCCVQALGAAQVNSAGHAS